jgi:predicted DCC family thiol-disulfide oxidoreductase YuxK
LESAPAVDCRQVEALRASPPVAAAIFDGDCGFCRLWVARWKAATGQKVDYAPSQEVAARFPEIPQEAFAHAFQLVLPDGEVLEAAEAVLATRAIAARSGRFWLAAYRRVPGVSVRGDLAYRANA